MSAACHEFMLMAVKVNKKERTPASTVNTKATEAFTEFMKSGTHAVQYCTCSMQHAKGTGFAVQWRISGFSWGNAISSAS